MDNNPSRAESTELVEPETDTCKLMKETNNTACPDHMHGHGPQSPHRRLSAPFKGAIMRYEAEAQPPEPSTTSSQPDVTKHVCNINICDRMGPILRAALIEFIGSIILCFASCSIVISSVSDGYYDYPIVAIAIGNGLLLCLLIFATAAPSGGHLNPLITVATTLCGMCEIRRCVAYIIAQCLGYIFGALLLRIGLNNLGNDSISNVEIGGCSFGNLPDASAFVLEFVYSFLLIFIAFGVAFDPKQGQIYGQFVAPWFIGIILALIIFMSGGISSNNEYIGAGTNPARCLGPAVVTADFESVWVYLIAPLIAAIVHAPLYNLAPPHHEMEYSNKNDELRCFRFMY